jgi:hypothetical protein
LYLKIDVNVVPGTELIIPPKVAFGGIDIFVGKATKISKEEKIAAGRAKISRLKKGESNNYKKKGINCCQRSLFKSRKSNNNT